ncbi:MAG TPA: pteridine reductase [Gammaproteobacteria bacterium]|nr:pteridine reductase [Gammaproteobacteria bacterium]
MHSAQALTAKVALVTGAARRVGAEIARVLHQAGMRVALHYHTSETAARLLCEQFNQQRPQSALAIAADLQAADSENKLIQQVIDQWQRLDVLVNNASQFYPTPLAEVTSATWEALLHSNVKAPFFLAQAAAPFLAAQQGSIINITDIHAERPLKAYSVYCISKAALLMATKALAKELAPNVRVNAVAPGAVCWPEGDNALSSTEQQKIIDRTLLARAGSPSDIAKAVLFFVRDADYVTGQILSVDGGRSV